MSELPEMSESDPSGKGRPAPPSQGDWHDQVLGDAIGYTKGLVTLLDSLNEGLRRRGRELEEHRQRLAILQSERRAVLEERGGLEAEIRSLTADRDTLRTILEERNRDVEQLRHEMGRAQAELEVRAHKAHDLQVALADSAREVAELRETIRKLERDGEGHANQAARLAEMGRELLQVRESAAREQQDQAATRDRLAKTEHLLEAARRDFVASQQPMESLKVSFKAEVQSLTTERDALRIALEDKGREIERLRIELARGQTELQTRSREMQALQATAADSSRQATDLREIVRELERERAGRQQATARLTELEGELPRVRESAVRANEEQIAMRERLASTERLLETARRDLTRSQRLIESLRASLDEERTRHAHLEGQVRSQGEDLSRLNASVGTLRSILTETARLVGRPSDVAGKGDGGEKEDAQWADLVQAVKHQTDAAAQAQAEVATLRPIIDAVREALGGTDDLPQRLRELSAERAALAERLDEILARWRRFQQDQTESVRRIANTPWSWESLLEELHSLSTRVAALTGDMEDLPEAARLVRQEKIPSEPEKEPERLRAPDVSGATVPNLGPVPPVKIAGPMPPPSLAEGARSGKAFVTPGARKDRAAPLVVEGIVPGSGDDTSQRLQGRVSSVNEVGMLVAFDRRLSAGRTLTARLHRGGEDLSLPACIVEVLTSAAAPGSPPSFYHLIRFEHPKPDSAQRLKAFLA